MAGSLLGDTWVFGKPHRPFMTPNRRRLTLVSIIAAMALMVAAVAYASDADVAVADVTAPTNSVSLEPGQTENINITITVTGKQDGTATFKVYRDWTLAGGVFSGMNSQEFTVGPRAAQDDADVFNTTGTVTVAAGHAAGGPHTLAISVFDITNSNATGAKLAARDASSYQVTVLEPSTPADTTAPTITITTPPDGAEYLLNQVVYADYQCEDEAGGSGLASCVGDVDDGDAIDTSTVGQHSFRVDAADNAGNTAYLTHTYHVFYDFDGFFPPVDNPEVWNKVKAGQSVPTKFSLAGFQTLDIFQVGYPKSTKVSCPDNGVVTEYLEETATTNASGLIYDATVDQYNYVWKTDKNWAGQCRKFVLGLNDDSMWYALFDFRK